MEYQSLSVRTRFSKSKKREILSEHLDKGVPLSVVARKHGVHPVTAYSWKRKMKEENEANNLDIQAIIAENEELKKQNKQLKRAHSDAVLHAKDLEEVNDFLKKKWIKKQLKLLENSKNKVEFPLKK